MPMNASLANFITLYNLLSSWIIGIVILLTSILNSDSIWISNFISAFITLGVVLLANGIFKNTEGIYQPAECSLILTGRAKGGADLNVLFMAHIASFMMSGPILQSSNYNNTNIGLSLFFCITILGTILTRYKSNCNTGSELIMGLFGGIIAGAGWFFVWNSLDKEKFTYFVKSTSTNESCSRPSGQKFKCSVYKNGELIQNL